MSFAALQLVDVQRSHSAAELLAHSYETVAPEVFIRVLDRMPTDLTRQDATGREPQISGYDIARLFEKLDQSSDVSYLNYLMLGHWNTITRT